MIRVEIDYNRIPCDGAFSLSVRTALAAELSPGQVVVLDGGEDVELRRGEVLAVDGRTVCLRFVEAVPASPMTMTMTDSRIS